MASSDDSAFESYDGDEDFSSLPEKLLAVGLAVGAIAMFMPWWGYSYGNTFKFEYVVSGGSMVTNGFGGWGIVYFLALLVAGSLLFLRTLGADAVTDFDLPVADWFVYGVCAILMGVSALAVWDSLF